MSERLDRLVDREPRHIGRDLEKDMTRLAEIDRAEILSVLLLGGANAVVIEELADHLRLIRVVLGAERDVMDRAGALTGSPKIDDRAGFRIGRAITPDRAVATALGEA